MSDLSNLLRAKRAPSARAAVAAVQSGQRVFVHGGAATPQRLLDALVDDAARLRDVEFIHLHTMGPARYADPFLHPISGW